MRALAKWMIWWLVSVVGAAAGVLLGYIAAVIVFPILAFVAERWHKQRQDPDSDDPIIGLMPTPS